MDAAIQWLLSNIGTIGAVVGGLIIVDEALLLLFPSPSGTSVLSRLHEILLQILKLFPSQKPPPPVA
jgi:hypothetical protein